ncbi:MAG: right-handed parallel beta-helix repeat-containing protein, partial [Candidatus Hodarchaeales archaeon]
MVGLYGKPIIFWQNRTGLPLPVVSGQIILVNCSYLEVSHHTFSNVTTGVVTAFCRNVTILSNNLSNLSGYMGIGLFYSINCTVVNNSLSGCIRWGIHVLMSSNITLVNNSVFNSRWSGIFVENAFFATLSGNNCSFNQQSGIQFFNISFSYIVGNTCAENFWSGIEVWKSTNTTFADNRVHEQSGLSHFDSSNNDFSNNVFINNQRRGVFFLDSFDLNFSGNILSMLGGTALRIDSSWSFIIAHNRITCLTYGSGLYFSDVFEGTISNNNISGSGISLDSSHECSFIANQIHCDGFGEGFRLSWSPNNLICDNFFVAASLHISWSGNNSILNNSFLSYGIELSGSTLEHFLQASVADNRLNDNRIIFWQSETDRFIPLDTGQIFLINCSRISVYDLILSTVTIAGITSVYSTEVDICNNTIKYTMHNGIQCYHTTESVIQDNTISQNSGTGIFISDSLTILIQNNTVAS